MIQIVDEVKEDDWREFLASCDGATIYHTPEWKEFLQNTFGYESCYLFAKDEFEKISGLLPLFYVKSKLTGKRLCSVPFSHLCSPIGSRNDVNLLIRRAISLFEDLKINYLEIRDQINIDGFECQSFFSTYILELSSDIKETWEKLDSKKVKRAIRKSQREGVSVSITKNIEDLKKFYELNCMTKRAIGVPCHPWIFFKNLFSLLDDFVSLYVAKYDNNIIAGGMMECFKNTMLYGYAAADPRYLRKHPYEALIWKGIEEACSNGYRYFDFGRASHDNVGLIVFKKKWGTIEKKLYYSHYPRNPMLLTENRDNFKYKAGTKVIKNMPMPLYKKFSELVFGSFG
ncbi:MAG: GNAT family N-acetyltransferase [Peptococcaceae bacterium]|nr:MAG: GNAT family N-acetyltransferase [Peptococcaceae bacterium]